MRRIGLKRTTAETDVSLTIDIDGCGKSEIKSGCGFLDHMLILFAKHARFDINLTCSGDTYVDYHHTVEDVGISLGQAFLKALGDKKGISRYADCMLPMDESLILSAVDISGRDMLCWCVDIPAQKVGDFDTELAEEFWRAFVRESGITLHVKQISGTNSHHIIEAIFKSVARCLRLAVAIDTEFAEDIPSTKGCL